MQEFTATSEAFDTSNSCNLLLVSILPFSVRFSINLQNRLALIWIKKDAGGGGKGEEKHFQKNSPRPGSLYFSREVLANPASTYRWHSNLPFRSLLLICPTPTWELSVLTSLLWLPVSSATQEH